MDKQYCIRKRDAKARAKENSVLPNSLVETLTKMETSGRFCIDCGLYITVAQLNNWLTPHICPAPRWTNRPPIPYYVVRKEDRDKANRKRIREENNTVVGTSTTQEEISPRKKVVRVMEVGGEDSLRELQRLIAAIGCLLDERRTVLHRRLHEVLQGALKKAEEERRRGRRGRRHPDRQWFRHRAT